MSKMSVFQVSEKIQTLVGHLNFLHLISQRLKQFEKTLNKTF